jgi:hypothetical protein
MILRWIFDPAPPSGSRRGGLANAQVFDPSLDAFVREVLQNSSDQRIGDDRVDVRFTLTEISGARLEAFLEAVRWAQLADHVRSAARPELVTIGPRLGEGLRDLEAGRLRLLGIHDFQTHGLTGGEDDESNFAALVRHELITSGERRASGGSFGLGKSVLWRFSNLSTVLFYSLPVDLQRERFIARTVLAGHDADGQKWEGSGWAGVPDPENALRAVSVWDDEARRLAQTTYLARPDGATGTSILVVGFDDPGHEVETSIEETCEEMVASATRWFWPALLNGRLSVLVEGFEDDRAVFAAHAQASNLEVAPFVHAQTDSVSVDNALELPGDLAEREITISIPAQRPERFGSPRPSTMVRATLRVRLAESTEKEHWNTVALQRGTGMVVEYREFRTRPALDQAFHAVLLAGGAHGDSDDDEALEEFLRAAEPPAHAQWTHTTDRIKAEYAQGFKKALDDLFKSIDEAVRDLAREDVVESDEGPDALRKLFPLPGLGGGLRTETYRLTETRARLVEDRWQFDGSFRRNPVDEHEAKRNWQFKVALAVDQEGTGTATRIPVSDLTAAPPAVVSEIGSDGTVTVAVPAGTDEVAFAGASDPILELPPGGLRRVRLRMEVKGSTDKELAA